MVMQNSSLSWWQIGILGLLIFFPLIGMSPNLNLGPDSGGYINFGVSRPPLYPLFIWAFHIFGNHQYIIVRWVQAIFTFVALLYAGNWLSKNLEMPRLLIFFILLFIISLISLHSRTLALIYSEGITFPIFIFTFLSLVESFRFLDKKNLIKVVTGIGLLILTRDQFYFFYPIILSVVIWHWWRKESIKKILSSLSIILVSFLTTLFFAQEYYHWVNKHISRPPDTGIQWQYSGWRLLEQPIYLSDSSASQYFQNSIEKNLFEKILKQLEDAKLTRSSAATALHINYLVTAEYHYMSVLGEIQDEIRNAIGHNKPLSMSGDQVNALVLHMSKVLYLHAIKENLAFYILRITFYLGSFWIFLASMIALFAMGYRVLSRRDWILSINQAFIMASFLIILGNAALVALVEIQAPRYFYYSYFLYFCLFGLLAKEFINDADEDPPILSNKPNN